jgi:hypothetical protein
MPREELAVTTAKRRKTMRVMVDRELAAKLNELSIQ